MTDTEYKLRLWRGDQLGAERLAAAVLHLDGFSSVDPQCPLGGPDGLKDLLCEKNDWRYVAAAYFPNSDQKFKAVRDKFLHDLVGVSTNNADGLVFITNQELTPGEREELSNDASAAGCKSILYHLERVRALLDSPAGYGARLEFLAIPMSLEEQLSFISRRDASLSKELKQHTATVIAEIGRRIDRLQAANAALDVPIAALGNLGQRKLFRLDEIPGQGVERDHRDAPTAHIGHLSVDLLCLLHSALLFESFVASNVEVGRLRSCKILIGSSGAPLEQAAYAAPAPEAVRTTLDALLSEWNAEYPALFAKEGNERVAAIARFHYQFLRIHPFNDGNGRVAEYLLTLQARALLGEQRRVVIEERGSYFAALAKADTGDLADLQTLLTQAIFGREFVPGSPCQMSGQRCPSCRIGVMNISSDRDGVECGSCKLYIPA